MATSVKPKICENGMLSDIWIKSPRRKIIIVAPSAPGPYSHPQNEKPDKCETRMSVSSFGESLQRVSSVDFSSLLWCIFKMHHKTEMRATLI